MERGLFVSVPVMHAVEGRLQNSMEGFVDMIQRASVCNTHLLEP